MSTLEVTSAGAARARPSRPPVVGLPFDTAKFSVESFVESFPILIQADGGTNRLKNFVFELAVRGALSHRDPRDQAAQALLVQIAATRAKASLTGKPRTATLGVSVAREELFGLPETWEWTTVATTFDVVGGIQKTPLRAPKKNHYPYLRVENVQRGRLDLERMERFELEEGELQRRQLQPGDLLVVEGNGSEKEIGRCALWGGEIAECVHQNHIIRCRPIEPALGPFTLLFLNSPSGMAEMRRLAITTSGLYSLSVGKIRGISFPLPPLAEQKRIVARVDQLRALIDELEAKQTRKREVGARFTKASLEALMSAKGLDEFEAAWKRTVENWETVLDRPEKVIELRRRVQELAVRGALGTQRSGEHTNGIEAVLTAQRADLMVGRRSGGRDHGKNEDEEAAPPPHTIPTTWRWLRLRDVAGHIVDGTHHTPKYVERGCDFISAKDIRGGRIMFDGCRQITKQEFDELTKRCSPKRGDVLITKSGSIGEMAIVDTDRPFTLFESVALIPVVPAVNSRYAAIVAYLGASGKFGSDNKKGVGVPHLHLVDLRRIPFPLPPRPEQDRIVAKVEQLMKLCDELEAKLHRAEDRASKLVEAVVQEMVG